MDADEDGHGDDDVGIVRCRVVMVVAVALVFLQHASAREWYPSWASAVWEMLYHCERIGAT